MVYFCNYLVFFFCYHSLLKLRCFSPIIVPSNKLLHLSADLKIFRLQILLFCICLLISEYEIIHPSFSGSWILNKLLDFHILNLLLAPFMIAPMIDSKGEEFGLSNLLKWSQIFIKSDNKNLTLRKRDLISCSRYNKLCSKINQILFKFWYAFLQIYSPIHYRVNHIRNVK